MPLHSAKSPYNKCDHFSNPFFLGPASEHQYASRGCLDEDVRGQLGNTKLESLSPQLQRIKLPCRRATTFYYCVPLLDFLQCRILIFFFQLEIHKGNLCTERYNEGHTLDLFPKRTELSAPEIFFLTVWLTFWCQHQLLVKSSNQPG